MAGNFSAAAVKEFLIKNGFERRASELVSAASINGQQIPGSPGLLILNNIVALPHPSILVTENNEVLGDSLHYPRAAPTLQIPTTPPACKHGLYLFLDGLWSEYFWHWTVEYLPRAIAAQSAKLLPIHVISDRSPPFVEESLTLIGVEPERIVRRGNESWQVESVVIPPILTGTAGHGRESIADYPQLLLALRAQMLSTIAPSEPPKQIYISRRKAKRGRGVTNERELIALLHRHKVEAAIMEELSLRDQITLVSNCKLLIAPHGAGIIHALFMPERSTIIELLSAHTPQDTNEITMNLLQHRHKTLLCSTKSAAHHEQFEVPLQELEALLDNFSANYQFIE